MAYSFVSKSWNIPGEHDFGDFVLLNATLKPLALTVQGDRVHMTFAANENGGVYTHNVHVTYTTTTQTDINLLADEIVTNAFPTATEVV